MATYTETEVCPVCGTRGTYQVNCNGDYDSPDKPREASPATCKGCAMMKRANPFAYDIAMTLWSKLLDERKARETFAQKLYKSTFDSHDLTAPFGCYNSSPAWGELAKKWRTTFAGYAKIVSKRGGDPQNDSWVWERTAKDFVFHIIRLIEKEKVKP